jgi:hypothetical protein
MHFPFQPQPCVPPSIRPSSKCVPSLHLFLFKRKQFLAQQRMRGWGDLKNIEEKTIWDDFHFFSLPHQFQPCKVIPPPGRPLISSSPSCFIMWIHNILKVICKKTTTSSRFSNRTSPLMMPLLAFFPLPHAEQEASLPNLFLGTVQDIVDGGHKDTDQRRLHQSTCFLITFIIGASF